MAAATDKFVKVGSDATITSLEAPGKSIGAGSINIGSAANWPTDTGVVFSIRKVALVGGESTLVAGTYTVWRGTVSGNVISNLTLVSGTDQAYSAGQDTQVYISVSAEQHNSMVAGILNFADQDATLKAGAVDNAAVLASDVVETAKIKDLNVTTAKLATGAATVDKVNLDPKNAIVLTNESTTSGSYTDLTTTSDSVSATIGASGKALVIISADIANTTANIPNRVSVAVSGATTVAAGAATMPILTYVAVSTSASVQPTLCKQKLVTGLTAGTNVFKMKYLTGGGTSGFFQNREITVIPL